MARALVDGPDRVMVSTINRITNSFIELRVAKSDVGEIIGKRGRAAQFMRTILHAVSAKNRKQTILEFVE